MRIVVHRETPGFHVSRPADVIRTKEKVADAVAARIQAYRDWSGVLLTTSRVEVYGASLPMGIYAMTRTEFEADLRRSGYEIREGEIKPDEHRAAHAHEFDARLFVLDGSITLVFGDDRCTYGPGDSCVVPAGTLHEEHTEADGVRYLAGRRAAAVASAFE